MVMNLKERMAAKKAAETSKIGGLRSKLGSKITGGGLRDKFKKRTQTVLDKTYEERNERSKGGSLGKSIFNQDLLNEFGIEEFSPTAGDHFIEVLPVSFNPNIPYFKTIPVHFQVGFYNDAFICLHRYSSKRCFRCETQAKLYRDPNCDKDKAKKLYPTDRPAYLLWERTKELIEGESPDYKLKIWASPKSKVHSEIQEKVRDKIHRTTLDISDISVGGEGRTVSFTIIKQGDFPDYKGFDLHERENPIPNEILEQLDALISAAEEKGYDNCLEMFLHIPTYEEVQESMETEEDEAAKAAEACETTTTGKLNLQSKNKAKPAEQNDLEAAEKEIMDNLESLQTELESLSKSPLRWRKWCKDNDYADAIEMEPSEAISAIIDDMYEKAIADITGDSH